MEKVFIQKIFQITEQILRRDIDDDTALKELQSHLKKAQQMGLQHYEVEVLNTFGVLYAMKNNSSQAISYWEKALEKSSDLNDIDTSLKLLSNLASSLLEIWDLDKGVAYAQKSLQIVETNQMNTLTSLYIYAANIDMWMMQGRYQQAEALYKTFWTMAETTSLQNYSRFEYAQIITAMYDVRAQLDIVARNASSFQTHINMVTSLVEQMNRDDFIALLLIEHLYEALILQDNDSSAREYESKLIALYQGTIPLVRLMQMANFLAYNAQPVWARKYAQQVLDIAAHEFIPAPMFKKAQAIMQGEIQPNTP